MLPETDGTKVLPTSDHLTFAEMDAVCISEYY